MNKYVVLDTNCLLQSISQRRGGLGEVLTRPWASEKAALRDRLLGAIYSIACFNHWDCSEQSRRYTVSPVAS